MVLLLTNSYSSFSNCFSDRKDRKYIEDGKRKSLIIILNTEYTKHTD